ncbi:MAG: 16S rRNA (guanine(527)-N(7))-methyltransferase RsmG [Candidatus Rokuibacteriota bacterium]|nr:MAG: 16S rRNA (guanine(527)-N(7))-methyltransferase RsmG [Candidatus Rokubacteria bacterium]
MDRVERAADPPAAPHEPEPGARGQARGQGRRAGVSRRPGHSVAARDRSAREPGRWSRALKWQKSQRLIGSTDPDWIVQNLFLDSLLFLKVLPSPLRSLLDLGSGAGVPGIPLKIVLGEVDLVLVESRRKRASFLSTALREVGLDNARVLGRRVEDAVDELEGRFDAVVMRCAGDLDEVMRVAARLVVTPGGIVAAAGPPSPRPLALGDWVTVDTQRKGLGTRRFAVYRIS